MGMTLKPLGSTRALAAFGWATLVSNMIIVVTGGAVRLTASGLGCPTWPQCQDQSLVPRGELTIHKAIEFGNRTLTGVLLVVAILTVISAWQSGRRELLKLSLLIFASIPAQAVVGGISVRTGLNPWVVSLHLVISMGIIALAVVYLAQIQGPLLRPTPLRVAQFGAAAVVLYLGTIVTGAGPHAGDPRAHRNGLSPLQTAQLHTDFVFLLVGLTLALMITQRSRGVIALLTTEILNAGIGFGQYFTHLPVVLVGLHMLGATLVAAASTWVVVERTPRPPKLAAFSQS